MKYERKERGHYKGEKSQTRPSAKDLTIELPEGRVFGASID